MTGTDDDRTLFARWQSQRDDHAFAEIARRHGPLVFDLAARACGDRAVAEDVLQEALLNLALETTAKPIEVGLVAWLARFAVCKARNRRASEVSRTRRQRVVGALRAEGVMPENRLERREELNRALDHAQPDERVVLAMRYLHGWGYDRIGSALSVSEGAARVRVHRALRNVRVRAEEHNDNAVVAKMAALPVLLPTALERTISSVLENAHAQLATGAATAATSSHAPLHTVNRIARFLGKGAGLIVLTLGLGSAQTTPLTASVDTADAITYAALLEAQGADNRSSLESSSDLLSPDSPTLHPRPLGWDAGRLGRLGRGETELGERNQAEPARTPARTESEQATTPTPERAATADPNRPFDTSRPTSREACAARCDSVSSDDERAGVSAGLNSSSSLNSTGTGRTTSRALDGAETAPLYLADADTGGITADVAADAGTATDKSPAPRKRRFESVPLDTLDEDQLALVAEASALLAPLVGGAWIDASTDPLAATPGTIRREQSRVRKQYRRMRRDLREAAQQGDVDAFEAAAAKAARISAVDQVLSALLGITRADIRRGRVEVEFPRGIGITEALEEIVRVLGEIDRRLPGGLASIETIRDAELPDELDGGDLDPSRLPGGVDVDRLPGGVDTAGFGAANGFGATEGGTQ